MAGIAGAKKRDALVIGNFSQLLNAPWFYCSIVTATEKSGHRSSLCHAIGGKRLADTTLGQTTATMNCAADRVTGPLASLSQRPITVSAAQTTAARFTKSMPADSR